MCTPTADWSAHRTYTAGRILHTTPIISCCNLATVTYVSDLLSAQRRGCSEAQAALRIAPPHGGEQSEFKKNEQINSKQKTHDPSAKTMLKTDNKVLLRNKYILGQSAAQRYDIFSSSMFVRRAVYQA